MNADPTETLERLLTIEELADRWRTTPAGLHNLRHRGDGPKGRRIGRRVLFRLADVLAFEETRSTTGTV